MWPDFETKRRETLVHAVLRLARDDVPGLPVLNPLTTLGTNTVHLVHNFTFLSRCRETCRGKKAGIIWNISFWKFCSIVAALPAVLEMRVSL